MEYPPDISILSNVSASLILFEKLTFCPCKFVGLRSCSLLFSPWHCYILGLFLFFQADSGTHKCRAVQEWFCQLGFTLLCFFWANQGSKVKGELICQILTLLILHIEVLYLGQDFSNARGDDHAPDILSEKLFGHKCWYFQMHNLISWIHLISFIILRSLQLIMNVNWYFSN